MKIKSSLFIIRILSYLIDIVISFVLSLFLSKLLLGIHNIIETKIQMNNLEHNDDITDYSLFYSIVGLLFFYFIYYPLTEWKQNKIGKKIFNLKTISLKTNSVISLKQSYIKSLFLFTPIFLSFIVVLISVKIKYSDIQSEMSGTNMEIGFVFLIYLLFVCSFFTFFNKKSQTIHDRISNTIVIKISV